MVVGRKDEMLREEQKVDHPFVKVDSQGRVYLNRDELNDLLEIKSMVHIIYQRIVEFGLIKREKERITPSGVDFEDWCKTDNDREMFCGPSQDDEFHAIESANTETKIWDPGVSVPEGFQNNDFQEYEMEVSGHHVKYTGKDQGYIDGKFYERTEFTRRMNCYLNGWETPDDKPVVGKGGDSCQ